LLQQPCVVTFNELEATLERRLDPTVDVVEAITAGPNDETNGLFGTITPVSKD
jgi:hypothetical protein